MAATWRMTRASSGGSTPKTAARSATACGPSPLRAISSQRPASTPKVSAPVADVCAQQCLIMVSRGVSSACTSDRALSSSS